jgi:hypothetical protein
MPTETARDSFDMSDNGALELVSAAADGDLRHADRAELDRLLAESPEVRRFQADLETLESLFRDLPLPDMPATLHADIMARAAVPRTRSAGSILDWLRLPTPALRYGLATAAGLLLAVAFYESRPTFSKVADLSELVGTMAPTGTRTDTDIVDTYAFRAEGLESLVQLERRNGSLLLDIRIDAEESIDIAVNFADAGVRLEALSQNESSLESIALAGQVLRIQALGRRRITALLHRVDDTVFAGEAKIELEFSSKGKLLQQGSLVPAW